jgi:RNA 2',3'-cyclic 3'-phosphodiesterase
MRYFIALDVPPETRREIAKVQKTLSTLIPHARITDNEKLHLTIAFIGEQPEELKEEIIKIATNAAENIPPFEVYPGFIDGFPHLHTAHILWIGVGGDIDKLYRLRHRIKDGLIDLNLDVDERRYVPHIAIAKINNFQLGEETEREFERLMSLKFTPIKIDKIKLFESIPNYGFHRHNTLAEIPLKEKPF